MGCGASSAKEDQGAGIADGSRALKRMQTMKKGDDMLTVPLEDAVIEANAKEHGVEIVENEDEACAVIAHAYAGDSSHDGMQLQYIILGESYKEQDKRQDWCSLIAHVEWNRICGKGMGGFCYGIREDGKLIAVCLCRRLSKGPIVESGLVVEDKITQDCVAKHIDLLPNDDLENIVNRMKYASELCSFMRVACNPGPYWFISMTAVEPQKQENGCGKKLFKAIHALADKDDFPCYLEASSVKNRGRFMKQGYVNLMPQIDAYIPGKLRPGMKELMNPNTGRQTDWSFMIRPAASKQKEAKKIPDLQDSIQLASQLGIRASVAAHEAIRKKMEEKKVQQGDAPTGVVPSAE
jgi:hypothetical protein